MAHQVNDYTLPLAPDQMKWYHRLWVKSFSLSMLSLIVLIMALMITSLRHQRERHVAQLKQSAVKSAELAAEEIAVSVLVWQKKSIEEKVNILKSHSQSIAYVAVYSQNKREKLFFGENFDTGPKSPLHQPLDTHPGKVETQSLIYEGNEYFHVIQPIEYVSDLIEWTSLPEELIGPTPFDTPIAGESPEESSLSRLGDLHIGIHFNEVENSLQESQQFFLQMTLWILGLACLVHYWQSKRLTGNLTILSHRARTISGGVYDVPLLVDSKDEIGVLSQSFQDMVSRLLTSRKEIEQQNAELEKTNEQLDVALTKIQSFNEELEQKVKDRTQALEGLNLKLQNTNKELRLASETKDRFLGMMSHELRTPLNAIIGFSQLALKRVEEGPQREFFIEIKNNGDHLLNLINDVLDFTKLESGQFELFFDFFEISALFEEVISSTKALVTNKPIELYTEIADGSGMVYGDRVRMKQVLLNFVSNSSKFTDSGSITLGCQKLTHDTILPVEIPEKYYNRTHLIYIKDTGTGISETDVNSIFQRFKQVDTSETRMRGTGLGLAISKSLMELHHSTIIAHSKEHQGTTMYCFLPFTEKEMKELALLDQ